MQRTATWRDFHEYEVDTCAITPQDEVAWKFRRLLVRRLLPRDAGAVLDVGSGDGALAADLRASTGARVVGVELSLRRLARVAARRLSSRSLAWHDGRPSTMSPPAAMPTPATVTLKLDQLERKPLAGEGNFVWKIPFQGGRDGAAVLKVYYGSRGWPLYLKKTIGNRLLTGRTSQMPRARFRHEVECVRLWEENGFRCFGMHPEVRVEGLPENGYMVFDWMPGRHFREYFRDASVPLEERMATWRRWVPEWHRRHAAAVRLREPRLIHENGDVKHVMLWEDGFLYFDFEICFTSRDVRDLVGREMLAYMRSVGKFFGEELYERMSDILVEAYPDKTLLLAAWEHAYRNGNPVIRVARALDRTLKPRHKARWSKYSVAQDIKRRLDAASLTKR